MPGDWIIVGNASPLLPAVHAPRQRAGLQARAKRTHAVILACIGTHLPLVAQLDRRFQKNSAVRPKRPHPAWRQLSRNCLEGRERRSCALPRQSLSCFRIDTSSHTRRGRIGVGSVSDRCFGALHGFLRQPSGTRGHNARHHEEATTRDAFGGEASFSARRDSLARRSCGSGRRRPKIRVGARMARRRGDAASHDPCRRCSEPKPTPQAGMPRGSTSGDPARTTSAGQSERKRSESRAPKS
jgi:hypothetical protein